jgi:hypothetical protein
MAALEVYSWRASWGVFGLRGTTVGAFHLYRNDGNGCRTARRTNRALFESVLTAVFALASPIAAADSMEARPLRWPH